MRADKAYLESNREGRKVKESEGYGEPAHDVGVGGAGFDLMSCASHACENDGHERD